jgi:hypothetical protein
MKCQSCNKGFAEWQCKSCDKIVCTNCVRNTQDGVYCNDCFGKQMNRGTNPNVVQPKKKSSSGFKKILITLIILDIGLALLFFIGNYFIEQMNTQFGQDYVQLFQSFGETILYGVVGITIVLFVMFIVSDKLMNR